MMFQDWDIPGEVVEFKKAVELDPSFETSQESKMNPCFFG